MFRFAAKVGEYAPETTLWARRFLEKKAKAESTSVRRGHEFDPSKLVRYLQSLNKVPADATDVQVRQFSHGQSNPTFVLKWAAPGGTKDSVVVRKQPKGKLLRGAHDMSREHAFASALAPLGLPVPRAVGPVCDDENILGTKFWVYEYIEGRHFADPYLSKAAVADRPALFRAAVRALARVHAAQIPPSLRAQFGGDAKHNGGYLRRQVKTWTRQFFSASDQLGVDVDPVAATHFQALRDAVDTHADDVDETARGATVTHGDFRPDNLIFAADAAEVAAILDWELATMGHPLSDLATQCLTYDAPPMLKGPLSGFKGLGNLELRHGIPTLEDLLAEYRAALGEADASGDVARVVERALPHFALFSSVTAFRNASIVQGVYARAKAGNASSANAEALGAFVSIMLDGSKHLLKKHARAVASS